MTVLRKRLYAWMKMKKSGPERPDLSPNRSFYSIRTSFCLSAVFIALLYGCDGHQRAKVGKQDGGISAEEIKKKSTINYKTAITVLRPGRAEVAVRITREPYFFSFSMSRISVSRTSSLEGAGTAGFSFSSAFFFISLLMSFIMRKTQKAMMVKSMTVCMKQP